MTKKELREAFVNAREKADRYRHHPCPYVRGPGVNHWCGWQLVVSINDVDGGHIYNAENNRNGKSISGYTAVDKIVNAVFKEEKETAPKIECAC